VGEAVADARNRFDRWAVRYERDPVSRWLAGLQHEALDALRVGSDDGLLDVGCGTGAAVRTAAPLVGRAVGVDLSEGMIDRARELAADLPGVTFERAESSDLPFEDGEFTAVLCTTSFHHYPDPGASVIEMARVLAAGGRIVIGDAVSDHPIARLVDVLNRRFDPSHVRMYRVGELSELLHAAGFEGVEARRLLGGGYAMVRARLP
jgi:ubiquinone/menaquinone biosynthesis C-methylase UbiE